MLSDESRKIPQVLQTPRTKALAGFSNGDSVRGFAPLSAGSGLKKAQELGPWGLGALAVCGLQPSEPSLSFVSSGSSRILERCLAALFAAKPKLKASSQGMGVHGVILWCRAIPAPSRTSKNCKAVLQHACPRFLQHSETGVASSCL